MSHPRVLHLGFHPIGAPTNSGLTLGTMFEGWPHERLFQLCIRAHPEVEERPEIIFAPPSLAPVDGLVRTVLGSRMPPGALDGLNNSVSRSHQRLTLKERVRLSATVGNDIGPVWISPRILGQLREFEPQVIHTLLGGVRPMRVARMLSDRLDIPIVPHFMDDWVDNLFADGQLWGAARSVVDRQLAAVLERSPVCLVIGTDMQAEFEERLARPCVVVGNSVEVSDFRQIKAPEPEDGQLEMRYVGGLHLGRDETLRGVAKALRGRSVDGRPWRLSVHVPTADLGRAEQLQAEFPDVVRSRGSLHPDEVPLALANSAALVFAESCLPNISRFTRLSVSTKVPQYIASWKPTLVIGPAGQGSVRALVRSGIGHYGGEGVAKAQLAQALEQVETAVRAPALDPNPDQASWVADNFGSTATRERLRSALTCAVENSSRTKTA